MRFIADGPDLPDDLLDARDEGQVIFFCGSGVSRAEAGGPNFLELAGRVINALGSSRHSPARKLLALSEELDPIPGVGGIPSADRMFAMLEQEFPVADVRRAVASALRPRDDAGLGPHSSLLDLSRGPDGIVRLVTTNFDRVFEQVDPTLAAIAPPSLPDPAQPGALSGIIHLHGKVSLDYMLPEGQEFVLSSADFGRAYLADGWATRFMRALMDRYRIVFVGYSADDPPMQYLLEALQPSALPGRLYALQSGDISSATGLWRHKGVTAIPFDGFDAMWRTLAAWAERARNPEAWRKSVAAMAVRGPRALEPHQRGQVAHLVKSGIGATIFAEHEPAPPAEWLCTFDPYVRYDRRRPISWRDAEPDRFDPFLNYGLDGELPPARNEAGKELPGPIAPPNGSWSAFDAQLGERASDKAPVQASLRGPGATMAPQLPVRLWRLARWFGRVATDPMAIWWAAGQNALHPDIRYQVRQAILEKSVSSEIKAAWRLILAAQVEPDEDARGLYALEEEIKAEGWSRLKVIQLAEGERPRLMVNRPMMAPIADLEGRFSLVDADVGYHDALPELEVPAEFLLDYIDGTRRNLVLAARLEEAVGGYALENLSPLNPFDREPNEFTAGPADISALMSKLAALVRRQLEVAPELAMAEAASWRSEMGTPFRNLRIWAASDPSLMPAGGVAEVVQSLGEDIWEDSLERDLLTALAARWDELPEAARSRVEAATLAGPQPWEGVDLKQFELYRINAVLRRLFWMQRGDIPVTFDLSAEIARLQSRLPEWDSRDAAETLDRSRSRGGWVATDKSPDSLKGVPLDKLLEVAREASGRGRDFLKESRPFRGLVESEPVRALTALRLAAARGESWDWAWSDFFWSEARGKDQPRLRCLIAHRLAGLPPEILAAALRPATQWFTSHARPIFETDKLLYLATWQLLVSSMDAHPEAAASGVQIVSGRREWVTQAINAPAGRLADLLFTELQWDDREGPDDSLRARSDALLNLPLEPRVHAAVMLAMRTNWLFDHDPEWTEKHLLSLIEGGEGVDDELSAAARTGFLRQSRFPADELFLRLKPVLLDLFAGDHQTSRRDNLLEIVLVGWYRKDGQGNRLLASEDLREALIVTSEQVRLSLLRRVARFADEEQDVCADQTVEFLHSVWPRQLAARGPAASAALVELALRSGDRMPEVTAAVLPVIETTAEPISALPYIRRTKDDVLSRFPKEHLALLHAALPEDAALWPWGMSQLVERFYAVPELKDDPRLTDLRRRLARA